MKHLFRNVLFSTACILAVPAHATFFNNATGLTNPDVFIDFESVPLTQNEPVTNQFESEGVVFENAYANPDITAYPNLNGNRIGNFKSGIGQSGLFTMYFVSQPWQAVALTVVASDGTATFRALMNGVLVESATATTSASLTTNFFGFRDIEFNQLTISVDSFNRALMIDNLQLAAVPEPASFAMLSLGLVLLGTAAHRNKHRAKV